MKPIEIANRISKRNDLPKPQVSAIRLVLVDDHELFRTGLRLLLSAAGDIHVAGEAKDKARAVSLVKRERPDVILLNIELQSGNALEMISDLLVACGTSRLAALTDSKDPEVHRQAMQHGAIGLISKEEPPEVLVNAIRRVHGGEVWIDRQVTARMFADAETVSKLSPEERKIASLTAREREVIKLAALGLKNKRIAERLFISEITVHHHLTSIYSKLGVEDRLELMVFAYRNRLAELPR